MVRTTPEKPCLFIVSSNAVALFIRTDTATNAGGTCATRNLYAPPCSPRESLMVGCATSLLSLFLATASPKSHFTLESKSEWATVVSLIRLLDTFTGFLIKQVDEPSFGDMYRRRENRRGIPGGSRYM